MPCDMIRRVAGLTQSLSLRKSLSWFLKRLLSKKDTLVSNDLCQRIYDSLQILGKALDQYRSVAIEMTMSWVTGITVILTWHDMTWQPLLWLQTWGAVHCFQWWQGLHGDAGSAPCLATEVSCLYMFILVCNSLEMYLKMGHHSMDVSLVSRHSLLPLEHLGTRISWMLVAAIFLKLSLKQCLWQSHVYPQ